MITLAEIAIERNVTEAQVAEVVAALGVVLYDDGLPPHVAGWVSQVVGRGVITPPSTKLFPGNGSDPLDPRITAEENAMARGERA